MVIPSTSLANAGMTHCNVKSNASWLIDSGATDNMTSHLHSFPTFTLFSSPLKVSLANDSYSSALGKECVILNSTFCLYDIL